MYYLDNAATTRPHPEVVRIVTECLTENFGNPSSVHLLGRKAHATIEEARKILASIFKVPLEAIIFCGSGSESINLALKGVVCEKLKSKFNIVTSPLEHPAVSKTLESVQNDNLEIRTAKIDEQTGRIDLGHLKTLIDQQTLLVTLQHVNNETGIIQDLTSLGRIIKTINPKTLFHVDAVQSFGKMTISLRESRIDMLSLSGHKIHGVKGCGALILGKKLNLIPLIHGGGQEKGRRSGTENILGIAGLGKAAKWSCSSIESNWKRVAVFSQWLKREMRQRIPDLKILEYQEQIPHIISLSIPGVPGEVLLHHLVAKEVYVSTGSACHSSAKNLSSTLLALKIPQKQIMETIRISLSPLELPEDKEKLLELLCQTIGQVREVSL